MKTIKSTIQKIIKFRDARDWEQFHDSKNLALALSIESAELNELFLWKKDNEIENIDKERLKEELADVLMYALLLCEKHSLNIDEIITEKIAKNEIKYPIEKSKGKSTKYDCL